MLLSTVFITSLVAVTSASEEVIIAGESVPGKVLNSLLPLCRGGGYTPAELVPDKSCITVPGTSVLIQSPATCANGTLARVAFFEGRYCEPSGAWDGSFIDISQLDVPCLDTRGPQYGSMMFYCDGPMPKERKPDRDDEKDEESTAPLGPKKGSLSDNSCRVSGQPMRAPTFKHPEPDTCVNIPAHRQVKVYQNAVCANGQPAVFARFSGYGCHGEPVETNMIEGQSKCMSLSKMDQLESSVAFVCHGVKQEQTAVIINNSENNGSILGLVLILVFVVALTLLSCALACLRSVNLVTKITSLFRSREGQISLS